MKQRYLTHIELPTTNLNLWTNIFSIIGLQIFTLNINSIDLFLLITYFPNLKSIYICLLYGLSDKPFESIIENDLFHSFIFI